MSSPAKLERAVAWELRAAWARRLEVVLVLERSRRVSEPRVRGFVEHVSPTNAFALVWDGEGTQHVPCQVVAAVRSPHFSEPLDGPPVAPPPARAAIALPHVHPGQLTLDCCAADIDTVGSAAYPMMDGG